MRCRRCSRELSSGADRCLRCFALNPQNVAGPLFAGLDSDPPQDIQVRFDDERTTAESPRLRARTFLFAWAIDFALVATLTLFHAGLAATVIGPERLAPEPAGSLDYWFDLFRGGGLWIFWLLLAALIALAYCALSALLLGKTPGVVLATLPPRESRLPRERSAP